MLEMDDDAIVAIGPERAARATLLPVGAKHEMVDDQLTATGEQIRQRLPPVWTIELVWFFHLDPRQFAALPAQVVAQPGELLLLGQ